MIWLNILWSEITEKCKLYLKKCKVLVFVIFLKMYLHLYLYFAYEIFTVGVGGASFHYYGSSPGPYGRHRPAAMLHLHPSYRLFKIIHPCLACTISKHLGLSRSGSRVPMLCLPIPLSQWLGTGNCGNHTPGNTEPGNNRSGEEGSTCRPSLT